MRICVPNPKFLLDIIAHNIKILALTELFMIKFILPALIIFLIILFWDKINDYIFAKFKIRINYIVLTIVLLVLLSILSLLYF